MPKSVRLALSLAALSLPAFAVEEVVLRPDLPAGEELYTPEAGNVHGMRKSGAPTDSWTDRFTEWLRGQALLSN